MFGRKKKDEKREQKLFEQLNGLFTEQKDRELIAEISEMDREERSNRIWFLLIKSYNRTKQYRKSFRELERMKENCETDEDRVLWHYLDSCAMFYSGKQMLAEFNLKKGLKIDPQNAELLELQKKITEKEEKGKEQISVLLQKLEETLAQMKKDAENDGMLEGCDEETFDLLLSYPAVLRQVPGIETCIGMEPLYRCETQAATDAVKHHLWSNYQALEADELAERARREWSTEDDFRFFRDYWEAEEKKAPRGLSETGGANFEYFQRFAVLFRETVGECGFFANEMSELMNLLRIQFACGMIDAEELKERMQKNAAVVKERFSSWEEYVRSQVCGAAYFAYKCSGGNFDEAVSRMEALIKVISYCDWFRYGWYSEEVNEAVNSGKEQIAKRQGKNPDSITILEALKEYVKDGVDEEALVERSRMVALVASEAVLDEFAVETERKFTIGEREYTAKVRKVEVTPPRTYRAQHLMQESDSEVIRNAAHGLEVSVLVDDDPAEYYLAQLKMIHQLLPDAVAVLDVSAEKILSGKWVTLAAQGTVVPSYNYLFTIQAVPIDEREIWLHTKGLARYDLPEMEILHSDGMHYNDHSRVLNTLAWRLLEGKMLKEKEAFPMASLANGEPLLVALVNRAEATAVYGPDSEALRINRETMTSDSCLAVLCYPTEEDFNNKNCVPLNALDFLLHQNPKFWKSEREKARIRGLAQERLEFMKKVIGQENVRAIIQTEIHEGEQTERLVFEGKQAGEGKITGMLLDEPRRLTTHHRGDMMEFEEQCVEDWGVFLGNTKITPDSAYMLMKTVE